ncbi:hypothetical protein GOBAR_AA01236 [Gossypium barbadense]|uniref:K-box domain-containing protein n=1 Tax=Gossypium barbadense TaxID=3634 RepID=A0A2P5YUN7_GOSBA|nr:hypothetical protein GOBAR_AA01236 [Gossypium barbadense]
MLSQLETNIRLSPCFLRASSPPCKLISLPPYLCAINIRHLLGDDLGPLNLKELQNLEKQLEGTLVLARQRKTQIMMEQMEDLRKKERQLGELNKQLKIKLDGEGQNLKTSQGLWSCCTTAENSHFPLHPSHPNPMECDHEPVLQIGYHHHYVEAEGSSVPRSMAGETNFIHGWVI